jgi:hypothetical protein
LLLAALIVAGASAPCGATGTGATAPHVVLAGAARDTLAYDWQEVLPVAISELEKNHWTIQRADTTSSTRRLVTRWKPLKHVLARVFLGDVLARCVVDLEPLAGGGTVVTIQGGLSSSEDMERSPAFPAALSTYRRAAEKWLVGVNDALAARGRTGFAERP